MNKTDKELAVDVVVAYLRAWSGEGKTPTKFDGLSPLIEMVYKTIHALDDSGK